VFDAVIAFCSEFDVREIALDPHETAHLAQELDEEGIAKVIEVQGTCAAQNMGVKETERLIVAGLLRTGGNACARWCFRNVRIRMNSMGERKLDKERSPEKIDLWSAAVLGIGRAVLDQEDESVYATRGILSLHEPFR
jgi:phage terminase large subunit-like protein